MVVTLDRTCRPSIFLASIFCMNVYDVTTPLAVILCLGYIMLNFKSLAFITRQDARVLALICMPILAMGVAGLVTGFASGNNVYDVLKDEYFFVKVLIYFIFGYLIFKKRKFGVFSETFIWYGVGISLIYAITFGVYFATGQISTVTVDQFRKTIPYLPYDPVLSIALLLFIPAKRPLTNRLAPILIAIQVAAVVSTMSRTSWLVLMALIGFYLCSRFRRNRLSWMSALLLIVALGGIIVGDKGGGQEDGLAGQIIYKVTNVFNETMSSKFDDKTDIQEKWRAYEGFQGLSKYASGDVSNWIFGFGFGALTDIGISMALGGVERTEIPIFHNGYIYLLVKLGAFGIFIYGLFILRILLFIVKGKRVNPMVHRKGQLDGERAVLLIILLFMCVITGVFFGIFNNSVFNNLTLLLAIMLLYYGRTHTWSRRRDVLTIYHQPGHINKMDSISIGFSGR